MFADDKQEKAGGGEEETSEKKDKKPFECPLRAKSLFLCVIKQTKVLERRRKEEIFCVMLVKVCFLPVVYENLFQDILVHSK